MRIRGSILTILFVTIAALLAYAELPGSSNAIVLNAKQVRVLELTASTPADHLSLARYYRDQARKFDEKARYHEEMAEMYRQHPLPFDGEMAVPMQRHCKEWTARFHEQAERAAVLATVHEYKAAGLASELPLANVAHVGLRGSGFAPTGGSRVTPANRDQTSLFETFATASAQLYDGMRVLMYITDAKGPVPVAASELRQSAARLFDAQDQFLASLSESQRTLISAHASRMQSLRKKIEIQLSNLKQCEDARLSNRSEFKIARKLERSLQELHIEQEEVGSELEIKNHA